MEHEAKQPEQCYMVTISFPVWCSVRNGWDDFSCMFVFKKLPTALDILNAVKVRQDFYTDHAGVHDFVLEACHKLQANTLSGNSGWGRPVSVQGRNVLVRIAAQDWFDNTLQIDSNHE